MAVETKQEQFLNEGVDESAVVSCVFPEDHLAQKAASATMLGSSNDESVRRCSNTGRIAGWRESALRNEPKNELLKLCFASKELACARSCERLEHDGQRGQFEKWWGLPSCCLRCRVTQGAPRVCST